MPKPVHNWLFSRIARKRSVKIAPEYQSMGGGSPIYQDTEQIAEQIGQRLSSQVLTFHRYLPETHQEFLAAISKGEWEKIIVFPMFPQFTYATTGSVARWFEEHLSQELLSKIRWIKSYPTHLGFVRPYQAIISEALESREVKEEEAILLFTAHGVPQKFVAGGDLYQEECLLSFEKIAAGFPKALSKIAFQSKFGPGEWLRPYTGESCEKILEWSEGRSHLFFVPVSFTSDHIETLVEIERDYLPKVVAAGLSAYRVPALNQREEWVEGICSILKETTPCGNQMLVRRR
jgi:protoporphyrin/coproporphyrin ferrochelatase